MEEIVTVAFKFQIKYVEKKHREQLIRDIKKGSIFGIGGAGIVNGIAFSYRSERIGDGFVIENID
jgi:hypothetical protein